MPCHRELPLPKAEPRRGSVALILCAFVAGCQAATLIFALTMNAGSGEAGRKPTSMRGDVPAIETIGAISVRSA